MDGEKLWWSAEARAWADSGAMALTGWPDQAPLLPEGRLTRRLDRLAREIGRLTAAAGRPVTIDWGSLLTGRAALLGLRRQGRTSANGSCQLLRARDGWVAVNLSRPEDLVSVGAVVGRDIGDDPWRAMTRFAAGTDVARAVERTRLLAIPSAPLSWPPTRVRAAVIQTPWTTSSTPNLAGKLVVDLSSMWAGPLTASILMAAGANVVKVEGRSRPDGARANPAFFRWLHPPDQPNLVMDFGSGRDRIELHGLLDRADVVIEASRPRALEQLGTGPETVRDRPGRVWLSITGYGRLGPGRNWPAFGDDAAVAGGLVAWDQCGNPVFCADAIADPITGLIGAASVLRSLAAGGGQLIDLALVRVAASMAAPPPADGVGCRPRAASSSSGGWCLHLGDGIVPVADPRVPSGDWLG